MGSLIALYRIFFKNKRWYQRIFFHLIDVSLCNAWLLYKRERMVDEDPTPYFSLFDFKHNVSQCLRLEKKPLVTPMKGVKSIHGIRPTLSSVSVSQTLKFEQGHRTQPIPPTEVREDQTGHFTLFRKSRGTCRNSGCTSSVVSWCLKCRLYLCCSSQKRCFLEFHGVNYDESNL